MGLADQSRRLRVTSGEGTVLLTGRRGFLLDVVDDTSLVCLASKLVLLSVRAMARDKSTVSLLLFKKHFQDFSQTEV